MVVFLAQEGHCGETLWYLAGINSCWGILLWPQSDVEKKALFNKPGILKGKEQNSNNKQFGGTENPTDMLSLKKKK